ncbi:unnamed protein product [Mesocestoides corti]|uniref:Uncharacterized protein n=1 Tax=Mesocestoides corti TaxID=53468 RepID=A0A158QUI6_MESCO|nr:unnamed protein product [Mesocestoides corti]
MRGTSEGPLSFSSFSAFPPHSMDAQTTTKRTLTSVKMLEKRRRRHHRQPLWLQRHATSDGGGGFGYHDVVRLPSPRHVQLFIDYLNPYLKQSISPLQIQFIINQWHLFRQTVQQNRRMQRLQAAEREDAKRRMQNGRQGSKKVDLFAKVVLRREAQALKRAASFAEFKRILMRASAKPLQHAQSIRALESRADLTEVSGGAVFHPPLDLNATVADSKTPDHVLAKSEDTKKGISKRSVDASLLDEKETASEYQTTLQKPSSPSSREIPSEELYTDEETEEHSDDELREAYNSYNDFLSSACKPKNKTLCTRSLFVRSRVDRSTLFLPPGIYVKRCDNPVWSSVPGGGSVVNSYQAMFNQAARLRSRMALKSLCAAADRMDSVDGFADRLGAPDYYHSDVGGSCTCLLPEEECLPTKVRLKVASVIVYNVSSKINPDLGLPTSKGSTSTEVIALTEHVSCGCQRRCENRRCIPPLQLNNYTYDDCYCSCPEGNTRCQALLDGRAKFTDKELQIPLNGSYILPPCYHGPMDEVHLYHRHCPRPDGRIGEFEPT